MNSLCYVTVMGGSVRAVPFLLFTLFTLVAGCAHADAVPATGATPATTARVETRSDVRVCEASYKYEADFADYWAARTAGGKRREDLPSSDEFVAVCKGMPEGVQRCLHEHYREAHEKECDGLWAQLGAGEKQKVDGLFLESGAVAPVDAGK